MNHSAAYRKQLVIPVVLTLIVPVVVGCWCFGWRGGARSKREDPSICSGLPSPFVLPCVPPLNSCNFSCTATYCCKSQVKCSGGSKALRPTTANNSTSGTRLISVLTYCLRTSSAVRCFFGAVALEGKLLRASISWLLCCHLFGLVLITLLFTFGISFK